MTKHIVTIRLPGIGWNDCMNRTFRSGLEADQYCCEIAELIDRDLWSDCVIDNDGRIHAALAQFTARLSQRDVDGDRGQISLTVGIEYTDDAIRENCKDCLNYSKWAGPAWKRESEGCDA